MKKLLISVAILILATLLFTLDDSNSIDDDFAKKEVSSPELEMTKEF